MQEVQESIDDVLSRTDLSKDEKEKQRGRLWVAAQMPEFQP